ncbi:MAG: copper chaperone PCu(A)C [Sphingosinicella sp.]|uniref:copper chaperone PCu(A)C n=1 Tax=Sphingosinicella sp. TaxID=1917971 RepID=UPI0040379C8F
MIGSMLVALAMQGLALENRIVRAAPAGGDAAGYVAILNAGPGDSLIGAECGCAERVEIHRIVRENGEVSMESAPNLAVPAGGAVEIRPGSDLHLMLINLREPLAEGQIVPMTLRFERGGAVAANFTAVADTRAAWAGAAQPVAPRPTLASELQPLAFLVGSCWRGTFPNTTRTDTHCFTALPGGRQVRDRHVVEGASGPYSGETIYRWDTAARRIRYDYYASDGGYSGGTAEPTATGIDFPEEAYVGADGQRLTLRNRMTREEGAYRGRSEMQRDGAWREIWTIRFERIGSAPTD